MDFYSRINANRDFQTPDHWKWIETIDMHTGGEPLRVIMQGYPTIQAKSLLEYRRILKDQHDHLRTAIMFEPRGHADMYGCLLLPPFHPDADCSLIFMHNEGYSTMCGHAIIGITTLAFQMGWLDSSNLNLKIEAPCGLIHAKAVIENGNCIGASFECVPSFVVALDETIHVQGIGEIKYDLAYGGAFYAYVNSDALNLPLTIDNYGKIIEVGKKIKQSVIHHSSKIIHPFEPDLSFLYGTIFIGGPISEGIDSRNVCVFADGEVDRSPTGSGVSGRMAIHHARNEIKLGEKMKIESIVGSVFSGSVIKTLQYGLYDAVIPQVEGSASVIGKNKLLIDPRDPFKNGFFLR